MDQTAKVGEVAQIQRFRSYSLVYEKGGGSVKSGGNPHVRVNSRRGGLSSPAGGPGDDGQREQFYEIGAGG